MQGSSGVVVGLSEFSSPGGQGVSLLMAALFPRSSPRPLVRYQPPLRGKGKRTQLPREGVLCWEGQDKACSSVPAPAPDCLPAPALELQPAIVFQELGDPAAHATHHITGKVSRVAVREEAEPLHWRNILGLCLEAHSGGRWLSLQNLHLKGTRNSAVLSCLRFLSELLL